MKDTKIHAGRTQGMESSILVQRILPAGCQTCLPYHRLGHYHSSLPVSITEAVDNGRAGFFFLLLSLPVLQAKSVNMARRPLVLVSKPKTVKQGFDGCLLRQYKVR